MPSAMGKEGSDIVKDLRALPSEELSQGFARILAGDVTHALQRLENADTQTHRREAIRTIFAAVEGVVWMYREHVLKAAKDLGRLTPLEEFAIQEKIYSVGERGDLVEQARFIPLTTMVRLTTKIAKEACPEFDIDFSHVGWANLKSAIAIRNRLTHPKSHADLSIRHDEVLIARSGFFWLLALVIEGMAAANNEIAVFTRQARELMARMERGDQAVIDEYRSAAASIDD